MNWASQLAQRLSEELIRLSNARIHELTETLTTSKEAYRASVAQPKVVKGLGQIGLHYGLKTGTPEATRAKIVEEGQPGWAMKPRLLGPKQGFGKKNSKRRRLALKQSGGGSNVAFISWNSKSGWYHPPVTARRFLEKVNQEQPKLVLQAAANVMRGRDRPEPIRDSQGRYRDVLGRFTRKPK